MRFYELLQEGRDAPLYHWMPVEKAITVLRTNRLRPRFAHKGVGHRGISLSRNKHFNPRSFGSYMVRLTLDQTKLAQRYPIVPLDADLAVGNPYRDRSSDLPETMAEEYLMGNIEPLNEYLLGIHYINYNDRYQFIQVLIRYIHKYNVPFSIGGDVANWEMYWEDLSPRYRKGKK